MPDEFSDEAGELDQAPTSDAGADDDGRGDDESSSLSYAGHCHGGPWDTSEVQVRFPKGFLLIHMPESAVWIYDRRDDGDFYVRSSAPQKLSESGQFSRWRAAEEPNYDIRVLDPDAVKPATAVTS